MLKPSAKFAGGLLLLLAAMALGVWSLLFSLEEKDALSLNVFDVGQGDALFLETPDHYQILIDGGPGDDIGRKLGGVMAFWDREIDLVILTHPHADHVGGLVDVLKRYRVGAVIESNANYSTAEYGEWNRLKGEKNIFSHTATAGMRVEVGRYTTLEILSPFESAGGRTLANVHDASVAARVHFGRTNFLLMGDAENKIERELSRRGALAHTDVLKVGHHGSRTSSSEGFLRQTTPQVALISVGGKNRYGHPHQEVLDRLRQYSGRIWRTDENGDILITTKGETVETVAARSN
ncbi:MAG: MBL fold metallo-hydrolase [Candidatus Sungbacteria bacterium]|uniref:MBL fold metallo-hydrolase n=1 Tax=Candidatus Sungiibacteriota bacterium TaxID=2750080 RepID=A0A931SBI8_9BACT|nr:MBL fold metallo-hydrolase [Candidatus Sungbacteria bacterium]